MKNLLFNICVCLIFITLIGLVVGLTSNASGRIHYIGETIMTPEEYTQIVALSEGDIDKNESTYRALTIMEDGKVKYYYDFYSKQNEKYKLLNYEPSNLIDNEGFNYFKKFTTTIFTQRNILLVIFSSCFVGGSLYLVGKKPKLIYKPFKIIESKIRNKIDSKYQKSLNEIIAQSPDDIDISDVKGIICVRSWRVNSNTDLKSINQEVVWGKKELFADKQPCKEDRSGIYGWRLGAGMRWINQVLGIVELDGKYEYHPDGVIRAEHCKIVGLFINKEYPNLASALSGKYQVPIYLAETQEAAYHQWLYSESGWHGLLHNKEILDGGNNGNCN